MRPTLGNPISEAYGHLMLGPIRVKLHHSDSDDHSKLASSAVPQNLAGTYQLKKAVEQPKLFDRLRVHFRRQRLSHYY